MCASKEKLGLGHRHKDALPMKGPCTCRGAGEIQQGATRGTAVEPPPDCRKGLRKARAHCPPGRIQVGLVQTILGAAITASPLNTSCQPRTIRALGYSQWFSQVLAGQAPPERTYIKSPYLVASRRQCLGLWLRIQQNGFCLVPSLQWPVSSLPRMC